MKFLLCLSAITLFSSCAHLTIVGFDKEADTVTIQGGEVASLEDYQQEANNYCGKEAKIQKMTQTVEGVNLTVYNTGKGTSNAQTIPIKKYLYTFKCN